MALVRLASARRCHLRLCAWRLCTDASVRQCVSVRLTPERQCHGACAPGVCAPVPFASVRLAYQCGFASRIRCSRTGYARPCACLRRRPCNGGPPVPDLSGRGRTLRVRVGPPAPGRVRTMLSAASHQPAALCAARRRPHCMSCNPRHPPLCRDGRSDASCARMRLALAACLRLAFAACLRRYSVTVLLLPFIAFRMSVRLDRPARRDPGNQESLPSPDCSRDDRPCARAVPLLLTPVPNGCFGRCAHLTHAALMQRRRHAPGYGGQP
jgi:hypothetical protein